MPLVLAANNGSDAEELGVKLALKLLDAVAEAGTAEALALEVELAESLEVTETLELDDGLIEKLELAE